MKWLTGVCRGAWCFYRYVICVRWTRLSRCQDHSGTSRGHACRSSAARLRVLDLINSPIVETWSILMQGSEGQMYCHNIFLGMSIGGNGTGCAKLSRVQHSTMGQILCCPYPSLPPHHCPCPLSRHHVERLSGETESLPGILLVEICQTQKAAR